MEKGKGGKVEILTQEQACKRFPKRGYADYDPMVLVCGPKKAVIDAFSVTVNVNGKAVKTRPALKEVFFDIECDNDYRVVIWI